MKTDTQDAIQALMGAAWLDHYHKRDSDKESTAARVARQLLEQARKIYESRRERDNLPWSAEWVEDCGIWRERLLEGKHGHWCLEWDGLPVDETTAEHHHSAVNVSDPKDNDHPCHFCGFSASR